VHHRRFFAPVAAARQKHYGPDVETDSVVTAQQIEIELSASV
jgi:hypothetical protein